MTSPLFCIVGAGPAAVACAHALLAEGRRVMMIDPGKSLPPHRKTYADSFRASPHRHAFVAQMRAWQKELRRDYRRKKLPLASSYLYNDVEKFWPHTSDNCSTGLNLASGGLSTIWGATAIPLTERSFRHWPVSAPAMKPYYRQVAGILDAPVIHDDLEPVFSNYGCSPALPLSEQAREVMSHLLNNRQKLRANGVSFGRSRNAIGPRWTKDGRGCVACGLCMYGCPYQAIFDASYVIGSLRQNPNFVHRSGWIAEDFVEEGQGVNLRIRSLETDSMETIRSDRLFIAGGAAMSLRLIISAKRWFDHEFRLCDTQQFSIPAFLASPCRSGPIPADVALGQLFLEVAAPAFGDDPLHLQVYGYNPFIADLLKARWGIPPSLLQPFFDRLMVIMGYLPTTLSGYVSVKGSSSGQFVFSGVANPQSRPLVRQLGWKLFKLAPALGFLPALPLIEIPESGASMHLTGGLPMRQNPGFHETDRLGRIGGEGRIHVVDGACFPDFGGEHPTYTIMANAARIATETIRELEP